MEQNLLVARFIKGNSTCLADLEVANLDFRVLGSMVDLAFFSRWDRR